MAVAVSKCLLWSGLNLVTPNPDMIYYPFYLACFISKLTNCYPFISSNAISMSLDSLPRTYIILLLLCLSPNPQQLSWLSASLFIFYIFSTSRKSSSISLLTLWISLYPLLADNYINSCIIWTYLFILYLMNSLSNIIIFDIRFINIYKYILFYLKLVIFWLCEYLINFRILRLLWRRPSGSILTLPHFW